MNTSLWELVEKIDEPNRTACKNIYSDNKALFDKAQGSSHNHQAWEGGYLGHIQEIMNIACMFYECMSNERELPFSLSDALLVLYIHDLEKPWKYGGAQLTLKNHDEQQAFIEDRIQQYGFQLTAEHRNALKYVHGEGKNYSTKRRTQTPLAAFVHICDTVSARIWYDHPTSLV